MNKILVEVSVGEFNNLSKFLNEINAYMFKISKFVLAQIKSQHNIKNK
tara:strand:- start:1133 stop:1276 length:144 start_codon:yes stop_codon:yes gene_type:complete